jgi:uncharacterized protein DUF3579
MLENSYAIHLIKGKNRAGKVFRPGDWAERLCDAVTVFHQGSRHDARSTCFAYMQPTIDGDVKALRLDTRFRNVAPIAFDFALGFARDNDLIITTLQVFSGSSLDKPKINSNTSTITEFPQRRIQRFAS